MVRVAVVGLGWWGRIIVGLLKSSQRLMGTATASMTLKASRIVARSCPLKTSMTATSTNIVTRSTGSSSDMTYR